MRSTGGITEERLDYNQCQEAVRRLNDYLSHELPPEEEEAVTHHLEECRGCFAKFHFEETLLRTIQTRLHEVHAPTSLRTRVLNMLLTSESAPESAPPDAVAPLNGDE